MKKRYVRPTMVGERFVANEYVAACGDEGAKYKFMCNAGAIGSSYYVYLNGPDGIAGTSDDIAWSKNRGKTFTRCGTTHEASVTSDFSDGYMREIKWVGFKEHEDSEKIPVIVWTNGGTNTHCTANLKKEEWETTKS